VYQNASFHLYNLSIAYNALQISFYLHSQVVSAYDKPDRMELNYHARIATRTLAQSALAFHASIQCFDSDHADVITAANQSLYG